MNNGINRYVHVECQIVNILRHRTDINEVDTFIAIYLVNTKECTKSCHKHQLIRKASTDKTSVDKESINR